MKRIKMFTMGNPLVYDAIINNGLLKQGRSDDYTGGILFYNVNEALEYIALNNPTYCVYELNDMDIDNYYLHNDGNKYLINHTKITKKVELPLKILFNSNNKYPKNYCAGFLYAHGDLQDLIDTNIIYFPCIEWNEYINKIKLPFDEGIHKCMFIIDGKEHTCKLYYWLGGTFKHNGMFVLDGDIEANTYAINLFNNKTTIF